MKHVFTFLLMLLPVVIEQVFLIRLWVMAVACSVYFNLDLIL